jgi:mono/diheme cytochrome c family protein
VARRGLRQALAVLCGIFAAGVAAASEMALTVVVGGRTTTYSASELLADPATAAVSIPNDVAYKRAMTFQAVPVATLLGGIAPNASVRFVAADGFAVTLQADALLADDERSPRALLAVEPPDAPWPPRNAHDPLSAGPFYLVWDHAERARLVPEQWAYRVVRIEQTAPLAQRFPAMVPTSGLAADASVRRGYTVAVKNCIVCHTMNLGGDATIGPDLNVPYNATEYLRLDALRRLIRDPQSLRHWPRGKMPGFGVAILSDRELNDLLAYLRYMANRKVAVPAPSK